MKFSDIEQSQWEELSPYLDTCLLPVTGLNGAEAPHEVTGQLEQLRDVMELVEIPFKGRIVTYPAYHYYEPDHVSRLEQVCLRLKDSGFRYIILITAKCRLQLQTEAADLILAPYEDGQALSSAQVKSDIQAMWRQGADAAG
ncbi:DUF2487 family protein [Paenibacillus tarimensis]